MRRGSRAVSTLVVLAVAVIPAAQAETGWYVNAGLGHTSNATRVETDEISDTIAAIGLGIALEHEGPRLEARLHGNATSLSYLDDTYDSDLLASVNGRLDYSFIPDRFLWTVEDRFGQTAVNVFEPITPENRQNTNVFSTGPDFIFGTGSKSTLRLSGRYTSSWFEETGFVDDQRIEGTALWLRQVSGTTTWGLGGTQRRVEYDLEGDPGYDQQELFATFRAEGARQDLQVDVGATRLADGGTDETNPLLRLSWDRELTASWKLEVAAGSEYRNTSDRFNSGDIPPNAGTTPVTISNVPTESRYANATLRFERVRTRFYVGVGYTDDEGVRSDLFDESTTTLSAGFNRKLRQRLELHLDARHGKREFGGVGGEDETNDASLRIEYRLGKATFLSGGYRYEKRESDLPLNSYTDNMYFVSVSYRRGETGDARPALF